MQSSHIKKTSVELHLAPQQVETVVGLLEDGSTIPFIARYRKEATGMLDEVAITAIRDRVKQLEELDKRRTVILDSIKSQGKLTPELDASIVKAETLAELEDLYLPYKPKRRTRGMIAREKGLEPLALEIFKQDAGFDPAAEAVKFVDKDKDLAGVDLVLAGARDIIAEWVNETAEARAQVRELFLKKGIFHTKAIKGKEELGIKFKDYFAWEEAVATAPSHRVLAARRGEKEGFLLLRITASDDDALGLLKAIFLKPGPGRAIDQVGLAVEDAYKRLMAPSIENEVRLLT